MITHDNPYLVLAFDDEQSYHKNSCTILNSMQKNSQAIPESKTISVEHSNYFLTKPV